jgi:hypothetical protein
MQPMPATILLCFPIVLKMFCLVCCVYCLLCLSGIGVAMEGFVRWIM